MKTLYFVLCITVTVNGYAQQFSIDSSSQRIQYETLVQSILDKQALPSGAKTTAMPKRLITATKYEVDNNGVPDNFIDSNILYYSSVTNGSKFDYNKAEYNYLHPAQQEAFNPAHYNPSDVMFDSMQVYRALGALPLYLRYTYTNVFDPQNRVMEFKNRYTVNFPGTAERRTFQFDSKNRATQLYYYKLDASKNWEEKTKRVFIYDSQDRVTGDTVFAKQSSGYTPQTVYVWSYDGVNSIEKIVRKTWLGYWWDDSQYDFTYYPNNFLKTSKWTNFNQPGMFRDSFGYQPGVPFYTYDASGVSSVEIKHLNSSNLPDTIFKDFDFKVLTYDLDNNPIRADYYTGTTLKSYKNYYYESNFDTHVSLQEENKIGVFPNPVKDRLTVSLKNPVMEAEIDILNSMGQEVSQYYYRDLDTRQIDISNLASGLYCLVLTDKKTGAKVVSQFLKE
jgi:hypothetical protein